jgi:hypothetical protein
MTTFKGTRQHLEVSMLNQTITRIDTLLLPLERLAIIGVLNGTEPAQAVTLAAEAKTDIALIVTGIPRFTRQQLIELEIDLNRAADSLEARLKPLLEPKSAKA